MFGCDVNIKSIHEEELQDLALKSPIIVVRKEIFCARVSNVISKLSERRFKNRLETGLGTYKVQ